MVRINSVPKSGENPCRNEDQCFAAPGTGSFSVALADGAGEGICSRLWAQLLVRSHARLWAGIDRDDPRAALIAWQKNQQIAWERISRRLLGAKLERFNFAHKFTMVGAAASFVSVRVLQTGQGPVWEALAIGDACLVILLDGSAFHRIPKMYAPADFPIQPTQIPSLGGRSTDWVEDVRWAFSPYVDGMRFVLMSDALALWACRSAGARDAPWKELDEFEHASPAFEQWVEVRRNEGSLRDDDTTLAVWCPNV
jgi:hypothetical protein